MTAFMWSREHAFNPEKNLKRPLSLHLICSSTVNSQLYRVYYTLYKSRALYYEGTKLEFEREVSKKV